MYPIKSENLGRTIWVAETPSERGQLLSDGVPEADIYDREEMAALKGITVEGLQAVQMLKDLFPGSSFVGHGKSEPREAKAPEPVAVASSTTEQMKLL